MGKLKWLGIVVIGAILVLLVVVLSRLMVSHAPANIDHGDLLIIILTVLSIMITILGLGLAILGVIGWATFESKLRDNSFSYFATELGKDGRLRRELEALIVETSLRGVETIQPKDNSTAPPVGDADKDGEYVD